MSFEDRMMEDGFRNEQRYMNHLMNKAEERNKKDKIEWKHPPINCEGKENRYSVEEFANNTFFLSEDDMNHLREGGELTVSASIRWVEQSPNPEWAYLDIAPVEEIHKLDEVSYDEDGKRFVDFRNLSHITNCTMSRQVIGDFPEGIYEGVEVRVEIGLSTDEKGKEWINVKSILKVGEVAS